MLASVYFDQSKLIFDQSKIVNKLFLKVKFELFKSLFQNVFKLLFLSPIRTSTILNFLSFSTKCFARFSSPKGGSPLYPFFFIYFQLYMHFFMHWRVIFGLCINWGFWCIKPYFVKLINGFCCYIDIFLIYNG